MDLDEENNSDAVILVVNELKILMQGGFEELSFMFYLSVKDTEYVRLE